MTDRKIDYSADGIQLEISPRAPFFENILGAWWYRGYLNTLKVLGYLKFKSPARDNHAMICEAVAYWTREINRLEKLLEENKRDRSAFGKIFYVQEAAMCQRNAWLSLLEDE